MSEQLRLVCATANPKKAQEIAAILGPHVELVARPPEVPEVAEHGDTLEANARLKARALCAATALPSVADDTGLEVDALDGAPGVRSARYAGDDATDADNVRKLLRELADRPQAPRSARFRTVAIVAYPDGRELLASGVVEGRIVDAPRGEGGFGYDPVFAPLEGDGRTFGEMSAGEKHAISHRGRAFRALAVALRTG
jgi:XTP/dITP diphosphohydrolase